MKTETYINAKQLLFSVCTEKGSLASKSDISNYKRIWACNGVICGLAALLDDDKKLIGTFKNSLTPLSKNQYKLGNIPSNIQFKQDKTQVSFVGLCGRVDTISWYIIGVCNYVWFTDDMGFLKLQIPHIKKGLLLLEAWEFNNKHLIYTPTSGNWTDVYPIEGYKLYDNCLQLWALQCYHKLKSSERLSYKIEKIRKSIALNFTHTAEKDNLYHTKALNNSNNRGFYENFKAQTGKFIGVLACAWSAAATIILTKNLEGKSLLIS